ncbi:amidohydrolase family protein [Xanthobacter versatilis]|uniref:amidohydrolase family protein n=1 Tax=Xanthobacter autotrophicus (strain ATCC BAA-1158 / Py2) TaxID=78245 RepID=UPI0037264BE6
MTFSNFPGACDAHFHIMDPRFPTIAGASVPNVSATVADYRRFAAAIGLSRGVVVQPSLYGTDNSLTLKAVAELGSGYRAVLVLDDTFDDTRMPEWHAGEARGVRFNQVQRGATTMEMMPAIARRIAGFGWHIQLHMRGEEIAQHEAMLADLPVPLVIDHLARLAPAGPDDGAVASILRLVAGGNTWVKLSGPYHVSRVGPPAYSDALDLARRLLGENDDRMLWGSDWPHVTEANPPSADLMAAFPRAFAPDEQTARKVLVDNPARLYGF